ncbi:hypothetical protein GQ57_07620 [Burkholderia sp. MSh2]|nr:MULTISPECIES: surface-adhesin E family protein [Burkholderia]KEZ06247.1 hypothetical protein GQ57_07620 [Burkholderia sp. MSh2]
MNKKIAILTVAMLASIQVHAEADWRIVGQTDGAEHALLYDKSSIRHLSDGKIGLWTRMLFRDRQAYAKQTYQQTTTHGVIDCASLDWTIDYFVYSGIDGDVVFSGPLKPPAQLPDQAGSMQEQLGHVVCEDGKQSESATTMTSLADQAVVEGMAKRFMRGGQASRPHQ